MMMADGRWQAEPGNAGVKACGGARAVTAGRWGADGVRGSARATQGSAVGRQVARGVLPWAVNDVIIMNR